MREPMYITAERQLSELKIIGQLSRKGFEANRHINQKNRKRQAVKAQQQAGYEQVKSNMFARELMIQKALQQQAENREAIEAKQRKQRLSRNGADEAFSLCVRLRANCTCERCGEQFTPNAMKHLHCSHNYSREYKRVRYHPLNAFALCKDCHRWFAKNKVESTAWKNEKLGKLNQQKLLLALEYTQSNPSKTEQKRIAAYYRLTARYLTAEREQGNTDYLPFKGY